MNVRDESLAANSPCGNSFKGYPIASGWMGWVPWYERYMLFTTEQEYYDYVDDNFMKESTKNETKWNYDEDCWIVNDEG